MRHATVHMCKSKGRTVESVLFPPVFTWFPEIKLRSSVGARHLHLLSLLLALVPIFSLTCRDGLQRIRESLEIVYQLFMQEHYCTWHYGYILLFTNGWTMICVFFCKV